MTVSFKFVKAEVPKGRAIYYASDLALEYGHATSISYPSRRVDEINKSLNIRVPDFRVIADTLTILFAGEEFELVGIDAYTNRHTWIASETLSFPALSGIGKIYCCFGENSDRLDTMNVPKFAYNESIQLLHILINDVESSTEYYRLSDSLIVGMSDNSLNSLFLCPLNIIG